MVRYKVSKEDMKQIREAVPADFDISRYIYFEDITEYYNPEILNYFPGFKDAVEIAFGSYDSWVSGLEAEFGYKLYALLDRKKYNLEYHSFYAPYDIDFKKAVNGRLHPKYTFFKGELREIIYYEKYTPGDLAMQTPEVFENAIVKESFTYFRDQLGFVIKRIQNITWFRFDDSEGDSKIKEKFYNPVSSNSEVVRRRQNNIDNISVVVSTWSVGETGSLQRARDLFFAKIEAVDFYIKTGDLLLQNAIQNDSTPEFVWLDDEIKPGVTCRAYIVNELSLEGL